MGTFIKNGHNGRHLQAAAAAAASVYRFARLQSESVGELSSAFVLHAATASSFKIYANVFRLRSQKALSRLTVYRCFSTRFFVSEIKRKSKRMYNVHFTARRSIYPCVYIYYNTQTSVPIGNPPWYGRPGNDNNGCCVGTVTGVDDYEGEKNYFFGGDTPTTDSRPPRSTLHSDRTVSAY